MARWYEKAMEQLEQGYDEGDMTADEFRVAMRELNQEYEQCAQDAARDAYDSYY